MKKKLLVHIQTSFIRSVHLQGKRKTDGYNLSIEYNTSGQGHKLEK